MGIRTITLALFFISYSTTLAQSNNVVHYWPLDELAGSIATDPFGGHDATLINDPVWQPAGGKINGALYFDGVDDRLDLGPTDMTSGTGLSVMFWFKSVDFAWNDQVVAERSTGAALQDQLWSFTIVNTTGLVASIRSSGNTTQLGTPGGLIYPDTWNHVAITFDGSVFSLFHNGSMLASTPKSGTVTYNPNAIASVGHHLSSALQPFVGAVDDIRIYDHGLSSQEILDVVLGTGIPTIIPDGLEAEDLVVFPNPAGDLLNLQVHGCPKVELFSATGAMVQRIAWNCAAIDLHDVAAGVYNLRLTFLDRSRVVTFITE